MPKDDQLYNSYLVQAVRKHPCLYNCNLREYSNKKLTNDAWESVAEEMNDSVVNCKEKWRNLRIVFSRHLQKSLSGNSTGKTKYYLYEQMEFLKPFVRCRISQGYLPYTDFNEENADCLENDNDAAEDKEICESSGSELTEKQLEGHFMEPSRVKSKYINESDNYEKHSEDCFDYYNAEPQKKKIKYSYEDHNDVVDFSKTDQRTNYRLQFLQSLLPDVEDMNPVQFRKFRKKVTDVIDEILDSTFSTSGCSST